MLGGLKLVEEEVDFLHEDTKNSLMAGVLVY